MKTDSMQPTILYLDTFTRLDASRSGLLDAFHAMGVNVVVVNFAYVHDVALAVEKLLAHLAQDDIRIDGIISINMSGVCGPIAAFAELRSIEHLIWFVDSPYFFSDFGSLASGKVLVACRNYADHPDFRAAPWVPFGAYEPQHVAGTRAGNIGFLGSLHHIGITAMRSMVGLTGSESGPVLPGAELVSKMRQPSFLSGEDWTYPGGQVASKVELFSFLSSHHRLQHLSQFSDLGLEIMGPPEWLMELWTSAPHLIGNFVPGQVSSGREMQTYLAGYKVCLNIFHLQNMTGGPNFRVMDAAANFIPCLSQSNEGCEEIFPDGVAALYYRSIDDARYFAKTLLADHLLRDKLTCEAAEIVRAGHTFARRAKYFSNELALSLTGRRENEPAHRFTWKDDDWCRVTNGTSPSAVSAPLMEPLTETSTYKNLHFWASSLSRGAQ